MRRKIIDDRAKHTNFNPRTPGGVRPNRPFVTYWVYHFNPRTPGGVRRGNIGNENYSQQFQSTHPGWGATPVGMLRRSRLWNFNPRTPGGVRHDPAQYTVSDKQYFNPRTPGGVRPQTTRRTILTPNNFNPRTPGGVRPFRTPVGTRS